MPTPDPTPDQGEREDLAAAVGTQLLARGETLATAESCTGGWLAQTITAIAGSSAWFDRGFISYSNAAKEELLDVPADTLTRHGAVSEPTARAMARGALLHSRANWAIAITGIAGPDGGTDEKPVGTVCFAWAQKDEAPQTQTCCFTGNRAEVRAQAVRHALRGLVERMEGGTGDRGQESGIRETRSAGEA